MQKTLHNEELEGIDVLETPLAPRKHWPTRAWTMFWPKAAAAVILLGLWHLLVWSGWKPRDVLPGPDQVFPRIFADVADGSMTRSIGITMTRAGVGFLIALTVGILLGTLISSSVYLRRAVGALITGLQSMPSISWFPLAILLFQLSEKAILFVVVLGAAPSIANGIIAGVDHIPRVLLRTGRMLGAAGISRLMHIVLPAAAPSFVAGLKQGWAFAWRSLLAGEMLVTIANRSSLGSSLQLARQISDAEGLLAAMMMILFVGLLVDALIFSRLDFAVRKRWGLVEGHS